MGLRRFTNNEGFHVTFFEYFTLKKTVSGGMMCMCWLLLDEFRMRWMMGEGGGGGGGEGMGGGVKHSEVNSRVMATCNILLVISGFY